MTILEFDAEAVQAGLADGTMILIDVRESHEFAAGHIPGSLSMPLSTFDPAGLPQNASPRVVFSCAAGIRSLRAIEAARAVGRPHDAHYPGGFRDWFSAGRPVASGWES